MLRLAKTQATQQRLLQGLRWPLAVLHQLEGPLAGAGELLQQRLTAVSPASAFEWPANACTEHQAVSFPLKVQVGNHRGQCSQGSSFCLLALHAGTKASGAAVLTYRLLLSAHGRPALSAPRLGS